MVSSRQRPLQLEGTLAFVSRQVRIAAIVSFPLMVLGLLGCGSAEAPAPTGARDVNNPGSAEVTHLGASVEIAPMEACTSQDAGPVAHVAQHTGESEGSVVGGDQAVLSGFLTLEESQQVFMLDVGDGRLAHAVWPGGTVVCTANSLRFSNGETAAVGDLLSGTGGSSPYGEGLAAQLGIPPDEAPLADEVYRFSTNSDIEIVRES